MRRSILILGEMAAPISKRLGDAIFTGSRIFAEKLGSNGHRSIVYKETKVHNFESAEIEQTFTYIT